MIEEQAIVIASDPEIAEIEAVRRGACGSCGASAACGTSLLDRFLGRRPLRLRVDNVLGAQIGDRVILGVPEAALLRAAFSAYLVPLFGLILGAIFARELAVATGSWTQELASLVGGLLGFALSFLWLRGYSARLAANPRYRPVMLRHQGATRTDVGLL